MPLHKSWQWVGAFGPDVMLCVAHARVGVLRRSWWAVYDGERLWEGARGVTLTPERAQVKASGVRIGLRTGTPRFVQDELAAVA